MLQYALYVYLISDNHRCTLYLKPDSMNDHHNINIDALFPGIKFSRKNRLLNCYLRIFDFASRISFFLNRRFKSNKFNFIVNALPFEVINFPNWINYTFIDEMISPLNQVFKFPELGFGENFELRKSILGGNSISIHIRRGDYVNNPKWRSILGDICDLEYYNFAISRINERIEDPRFFIFSDDSNWSKDNLRLDNAVYINWNSGDKSYIDMQLMSLCKHNIIANSTFSLMAAWLNNNSDKVVIAPSKWRNYHNDMTGKKFLPDNWIVFNNNKPNVSIVVKGRIRSDEMEKILQQSYSDFEVHIDALYSNEYNDDRVKCSSFHCIRGNHVFEIGESQLHTFSDRNHLGLLLNNYLINQIRGYI